MVAAARSIWRRRPDPHPFLLVLVLLVGGLGSGLQAPVWTALDASKYAPEAPQAPPPSLFPSRFLQSSGLAHVEDLLGKPLDQLESLAQPSLADLLGRAWSPDMPRLSLPPPQEWPAAGAAAADHARSRGGDTVDAALVEAQLDTMGVPQDARRIIGMVIQTYGTATRLHAEATQDLNERELAFLAGDPWVVDEWFWTQPAADLDLYEWEAANLSSRIDHVKLAQAADLLAQAVEVARAELPPLLRPADLSAAALAYQGLDPQRSLLKALPPLSPLQAWNLMQDYPRLPDDYRAALSLLVQASAIHAASAESETPYGAREVAADHVADLLQDLWGPRQTSGRPPLPLDPLDAWGTLFGSRAASSHGAECTPPQNTGDTRGHLIGLITRWSQQPELALAFVQEAAANPQASLLQLLCPSEPLIDASGPIGDGANAVRLPGLMIGGIGDNEIATYQPLIIELGGNDAYLARHIGGVAPSFQPYNTSVRNEAITNDVALVLDLGGDDRYEPEACDNQITYNGPPVDSFGGEYIYTTNRTFFGLSSCPSLGGALVGIAMLADVGGENQFVSRHELFVDGNRPDNAQIPEWDAQAVGFGLTQGAGSRNGIGILATWDGQNQFQNWLHGEATETGAHGRKDPRAIMKGLAQGAGYLGVGVLANFGSGGDVYASHVSGVAIRPDFLSYNESFDLAQGAAISGVGILYDAGGDNRFYAPAGVAQGAVRQIAGDYSGQPLGLLWAGPGDDHFVASIFSQASSSHPDLRPVPPFLRNHLMNTQVTRGDFFQTPLPPYATRQGTDPGGRQNALACLVDMGGQDQYDLLPFMDHLPARVCLELAVLGRCALSQGASNAEGVALLLDLNGDDQYRANWDIVQGSSLLGTAAIVDLGGHDGYRSGNRSQGFAARPIARFIQWPSQHIATTFNSSNSEVRQMGATIGLLYDAQGRDAYTAERRSQAYAESLDGTMWDAIQRCTTPQPCQFMMPGTCNLSVAALPTYCPNPLVALFIDGRGRDVYRDADPKLPALDETNPGPNDWRWSRPLEFTRAPVPHFVLGVDNDSAGPYWDALTHSTGVPATLSLDLFTDDEMTQAAPADALQGRIVARIRLQSLAGPEDVDRVAVLANGHLIGHARHDPTDTDPLQYRFDWNTADHEWPQTQSYPDGPYTLVASAAVRGRCVPGACDQFASAGEMGTIETAPLDVVVDNPPLVHGLLTDAAFSPAQGQSSRIEVTLAGDARPTELGCQVSDAGRATVTVDLHSDGDPDETLIDNACIPPGSQSIQVGPNCGTVQCPDGIHAFGIRVVDGRNQVAERAFHVLVDGTAPSSTIQLGPIAGLADRQGTALAVKVLVNDDHRPGPGNDAGVGLVQLFMLDENRTLLRSPVEVQGTGHQQQTVRLLLPGLTTGETVRLVVISSDLLGNREVACRSTPQPEPEPCYLSDAENHTVHLIDFSPPNIQSVSAEPTVIGPGRPVTLRATIDEGGAGVQEVHVKVGQHEATMVPAGNNTYIHADWSPAAADLVGFEGAVPLQVSARDLAGNLQTSSGLAFLDGARPRMENFLIGYGHDGRLSSARPGDIVTVALDAIDANIESVRIQATWDVLNETGCEKRSTLAAPHAWLCRLAVPANLTQGDHNARLNATDSAGNNESVVFPLAVDLRPAEPTDIEVPAENTRFDRFVVRWQTEVPSLGAVEYGQTATLGNRLASPAGYATSHEVTVNHLKPHTQYFFRVFSTGPAGAIKNSTLLSIRTNHSYAVHVELASPTIVGEVSLPVRLVSLTEAKPTLARVWLQDALARTTPRQIRVIENVADLAPVPFDSTQYADGDYVFVVTAMRDGEAFTNRSAVFTIDNTVPLLAAIQPHQHGKIRDPRHAFLFDAFDRGNLSAVLPDALRTRLDGAPAALQAVTAEAHANGLTQRVRFQLAQPLTEGRHRLQIELEDPAGNLGTMDWLFDVDATPPNATAGPSLAYFPGPVAARPGGIVRMNVTVEDRHLVASARLHVAGSSTPIQGGAGRGNNWTFAHTVPRSHPGGNVSFTIEATDGLDNQAVVASGSFFVDARPANVSVGRTETSWTTAVVDLHANEAVSLMPHPTHNVTANTTRSPALTVQIRGLRPDHTYALPVTVADGAGNPTTTLLTLRTPVDQAPPTGALGLQAFSPREGVAELRWHPATDNAGILHYQVYRNRELLTNATAVWFNDTSAPAGSLVRYRIVPMDVAGNEGPGAEVDVMVHAAPRLRNLQISPKQGPAHEPFRIEVEYVHAGGRAPEKILLMVGSQSYEMRRNGTASCSEGCSYVVQVRLPATLYGVPRANLSVYAQLDNESLVVSPQQQPIVFASGDVGLRAAAGKSVPSPGPLILLPVLILWMSCRKNRRRTP